MTTRDDAGAKKPRRTLTRERVLQAAIELADEEGISGLSMRRLGTRLGVKAMSLYNHVASKEELLEGVIDLLLKDVPLPSPDDDWKDALRRRAESYRQIFLRHPWALGMLEASRNPVDSAMRYTEAMSGCLRRTGFSYGMIIRALYVMDSYIYGHALQESASPFENMEEVKDLVQTLQGTIPIKEFPNLVEFMREYVLKGDINRLHPENSFRFGLEMIIDGLDRAKEEDDPGQG
ncbi:MAG: TetR/AcrR family transcriptional regulator C-terminal domain-containing protein [Deltaproteobacteria bacterium]|nr:TetR/AcrR family transcriptional regulator C-terminal domain-containing protein [Deltaproteobacteria bacterium]